MGCELLSEMIRVVEILGVYYRNKGPLMWFLVSMVPQMSGPGEAVFVLLSADDLMIMKKVDLCRSVSFKDGIPLPQL